MRKVAIIDCGTNTFHLLIAEVIKKEYRTLFYEKKVVKIGQGGINKKIIYSDAEERAMSALKDFRKHIDAQSVTEIHAFATSAFRNASNGETIKNRIAQETNIHLQIISGEDEASLIFNGITFAMKVGKKPVLAMDIGGGSVEFIIGTGSKVYWKTSLEIGAQRLMDLFHKHDPISTKEISSLKEYLVSQLTGLFEVTKQYELNTLIGASGTFETLSAIHRASRSSINSEELAEVPLTLSSYYLIHDKLVAYNREQRLAIPGMLEMRVDMIVVASFIIHVLLENLPIQQIRVSRYALKEGVLARIVESNGLS